jgi:energy-coupling factor transporter ATP-binding protein EcfA2
MKMLERLEIENYRNLKKFSLDNLGDLNILVGPNNSGKTGILQGIEKVLKTIDMGIPKCETCRRKDKSGGISIKFEASDYYFFKQESQIKVKLKFAKGFIDNIDNWSEDPNYNDAVSRKKENAEPHYDSYEQIALETDPRSNTASSIHNVPILTAALKGKLNKACLYIPSDRLNARKSLSIDPNGNLQVIGTVQIPQYIESFNLTDGQKGKLREVVSKIIHPKFIDWQRSSPVESSGGSEFVSNFDVQGSGVKALITVIADILFNKQDVILIDEPELGLNPFVRQRFLKFLMEKSKDKQIFIATQDSTFLNPVIWNAGVNGIKVSVYLYSASKETYVKIDTANKSGHTGIFAGYLPQTVSLKDIHIYLEGPSDAYIFQIFLEKYLRKNMPDTWFVLFNRIGVFYLGGDLYADLLYTIPELPYRTVVILDGDKRDRIEEGIEKFNNSIFPKIELEYAGDPIKIEGILSRKKTPVYCWGGSSIEKYLNLDCKEVKKPHDKVLGGPKIADSMNQIPPEINDVIKILIGTLGFGKY